MTISEAINSMSKEDRANALNALRAAHEGDTAGQEGALEAMSTDGLELFIALLEAEAGRRGVNIDG